MDNVIKSETYDNIVIIAGWNNGSYNPIYNIEIIIGDKEPEVFATANNESDIIEKLRLIEIGIKLAQIKP